MGFSFLVAGPGIEPGSGGYEPPEVPLLYPAIYLLYTSAATDVQALLILTGSVHLVDISFRYLKKYLARSCEMGPSPFLTPLYTFLLLV